MVWFCTDEVREICWMVHFLPNVNMQPSYGAGMVSVRLSSRGNVYVRRHGSQYMASRGYILLSPEQFMKKVIELSRGGSDVR